MTDWKLYVRAHSPRLDVRAEREAEIVDEFGITAMNARAIAGASLGLLIAAGIACLAPALRATRINPVDALRAE